MKTFLIATAALSVLASASVALAQPYDSHRNDNHGHSAPVVVQQHGPQAHDDHGRPDNGGFEQRAQREFNGGRYRAPRGYQARHWAHGDRLPVAYRSQAYRIDAHRYGLRAPPPGYQYSRVGNDAVLTAVASGVIASVILNLFQ